LKADFKQSFSPQKKKKKGRQIGGKGLCCGPTTVKSFQSVPLGSFFASRIIQSPTVKFLKYPALLVTVGNAADPRKTRAPILRVLL
jgi:hypothetical protein